MLRELGRRGRCSTRLARTDGARKLHELLFRVGDAPTWFGLRGGTTVLPPRLANDGAFDDVFRTIVAFAAPPDRRRRAPRRTT